MWSDMAARTAARIVLRLSLMLAVHVRGPVGLASARTMLTCGTQRHPILCRRGRSHSGPSDQPRLVAPARPEVRVGDRHIIACQEMCVHGVGSVAIGAPSALCPDLDRTSQTRAMFTIAAPARTTDPNPCLT